MFALADCNNFFASCERVFRPDLQGKPVIVLSNNDGCAVTRSNEAKALDQLPKLNGCQVHSTVMLSEVDQKIFKKLGVGLTCDPVKKE